jgi:NAD(P)-dependent dehydrogenase (short-subunit alcohol dehydrogenase family)
MLATMGDLDGKRIVVTGSTRGLGRGFALALGAAGASVVVNGTDATAAESVAGVIRDAGGAAVAVAGSVADDDVAARLVSVCVDTFGGIDAVVNNAGIVRDRTLVNMTPAEFDEVVAVNLRGTWSVSRHAAKVMRDNGGGLLLQIVSNSAFTPSVGQTNYAASKAGVMGMLYAWDGELARFGIRVNALWPIAETDMTQVVFDNARKRADADGRPAPAPADLGFGTPETVSPVVVYLCSDRAAHLRSQLVTFNGRKLAVWQHPREARIERRDAWSLDDLDAVLRDADEPVYRPVM